MARRVIRARRRLYSGCHKAAYNGCSAQGRYPCPFLSEREVCEGRSVQELKILQKAETLHEARWWEPEPGNKVHCYLCPRHCHIGDGQTGFCFIRVNQGGKLYSLGYVTYDAFHEIYDHIDAANVDLKAFTENFYGRITLTHLQPVLEMLQWLKKETNVWFEITNLIIPTLNDDPRELRQLSEWVLEYLGPEVPLHLDRKSARLNSSHV